MKKILQKKKKSQENLNIKNLSVNLTKIVETSFFEKLGNLEKYK